MKIIANELGMASVSAVFSRTPVDIISGFWEFLMGLGKPQGTKTSAVETVVVAMAEKVSEDMMTVCGRIAYVNMAKGYAFVDCNRQSYFLHVSDLRGISWSEITKGMAVSFSIVNHPSQCRAGKATDVRIVPGKGI